MRKPWFLRLVFVLIVLAGTGWPLEGEGSKQGKERGYVKLSEVPEKLETPVTFLAESPVIDGALDESLRSKLPERKFTNITKIYKDNPVNPVSYRLAYGTHFFYVYIETEADKLTFRDRAYQNGDGFHMVLGKPRPKGEKTDEFYVLACSAVGHPLKEWSRRIFWYYNVFDIFLPTSRDARMEFAAKDGKISFELYLPWKDVHPYHPWFSKDIAFNLCFVKAVGDTGKNYHFVVPDDRMQSELSKRKYARLKFEKPGLKDEIQTFVQLERGHVEQGSKVKALIASAGPPGMKENLRLRWQTGEDASMGFRRKEYECKKGVTRTEIEMATEGMPAGGYRLAWFSRNNQEAWGESRLTLLPPLDAKLLTRRLEKVKGKIMPGSYETMQFRLQELQEKLAKVKPYETCADIRLEQWGFLEDLKGMEKGQDVLALRTGFMRRAFRSEIDNTFQPYCVRVPENLDRSKKYPLMVYLHGSGSDETDLRGFDKITVGDFIQLGPYGRGTSHAYVPENAQKDIAEAIEAVIENYPVDRKNIFLSGFSMGGYGVYRTFYETPEKFKALVIISGDPDIGNRYMGGNKHPNFMDPKYLKPFKGVPMFIFHGQKDRNCPFEKTVEAVRLLKKAGALVELNTDPGKGHEPPGVETIMKYYQWLNKIKEIKK